MPRTRIKICGIRTPEAAAAAASAGADAIGFMFHPHSRRFIEPEDAAAIVVGLPPMIVSVAVFVNPTLDKFMEFEELCPTTHTQLHGDEDEALVRECAPVIKAIRFDKTTIRAELSRWAALPEVDAILVDGSAGGMGTAFDWSVLSPLVRETPKPIILAGGLTPDNVGGAIRTVRPFAVDVSSGVETDGIPGQKNPALIEAFCAAVRRADLG